MTKKQVGEKRVYLAYTFTLLFINKGSQVWNSIKQVRKQELMERPWRDVSYCLASLACSACFLIEPKTTSPEMVPPKRGPPFLVTN